MTDSPPAPRLFDNTSDWFVINRSWQFEPPADLHGEMTPNEVEAASGHISIVTLNVSLPGP